MPSHLRSCDATEHAFRCRENRGAAKRFGDDHQGAGFWCRQLTQVSNAPAGPSRGIRPGGPKGCAEHRAACDAGRSHRPSRQCGSIPSGFWLKQLPQLPVKDSKMLLPKISSGLGHPIFDRARLKTIPASPITSRAFSRPLCRMLPASKDRTRSAAWLGLTPKPHSSGGKERLGKISKMGNQLHPSPCFTSRAMGVILRAAAGQAGTIGVAGCWKEAREAGAIALASRKCRIGLGAPQIRRKHISARAEQRNSGLISISCSSQTDGKVAA